MANTQRVTRIDIKFSYGVYLMLNDVSHSTHYIKKYIFYEC